MQHYHVTRILVSATPTGRLLCRLAILLWTYPYFLVHQDVTDSFCIFWPQIWNRPLISRSPGSLHWRMAHTLFIPNANEIWHAPKFLDFLRADMKAHLTSHSKVHSNCRCTKTVVQNYLQTLWIRYTWNKNEFCVYTWVYPQDISHLCKYSIWKIWKHFWFQAFWISDTQPVFGNKCLGSLPQGPTWERKYLYI